MLFFSVVTTAADVDALRRTFNGPDAVDTTPALESSDTASACMGKRQDTDKNKASNIVSTLLPIKSTSQIRFGLASPVCILQNFRIPINL